MRISDWSSDVCSSDLWQHRKSLIRRGVRLVDMETRQSLKTTTLSGAWRDRIEAVNPGRGQKGTRTSRRGLGPHVAKVWPLVVFCWREGLGPHDVNDPIGRPSCWDRVCQ